MIQKLRRKFIYVIMGAAVSIFLLVFLMLIISTKNDFVTQSEELLQLTLNRAEYGRAVYPVNEKNPDERKKSILDDYFRITQRGDRRLLSFTAFAHEDGEVVLDENRLYFLGDEFETEEIKSMVSDLAEEKIQKGYLPEYRLRFLKRETDSGLLIAFTDASNESRTLISLVQDCMILGTAALTVIFIIVIGLSKWAVKPVEIAWCRQKQFLGDVSHELKTPLTVILSNSEMIIDRHGENAGRWAENIRTEALQMKYLTEQLLLLARSDDVNRAKALEKTDISYIVTDGILMFEPLAFESGKKLSYEVEDDIFVMGDRAALSIVVSVLLDNAVKYSDRDTEIKVKLETKGRWAAMKIASVGSHIDEGELNYIFDRFYRGTETEKEKGHGLGLAIAKNIVRAHKGEIWAESTGKNNIFTVQLPVIKGE